MASEKPAIVISHGAWHHPVYYKSLVSLLKAHGYTVLVPPLATAGADDSIIGKSHDDDVQRLHEVMLPHLDAGKKVIIVGHSYGGLPGTTCCAGQTVDERAARGLPGGVTAVVYIAAYAPLVSGKALHDFDTLTDFFDVDETTGVAAVNRLAIQRFYSDLPQKQQEAGYDMLVNHSLASFVTPVSLGAAELKIPKTYIVCLKDQCVLPAMQREIAEGCGAKIVEVDCGHSPFMLEGPTVSIVEAIETAAAL